MTIWNFLGQESSLAEELPRQENFLGQGSSGHLGRPRMCGQPWTKLLADESDPRRARPHPEHAGPVKHWLTPEAKLQRHQYNSVITAELDARQQQLTRCSSALLGAKVHDAAADAINIAITLNSALNSDNCQNCRVS
eukprot:1764721-Pleurochrysis_carterae.AAC.7